MLIFGCEFHSSFEVLVNEFELVLPQGLKNVGLRKWIAQQDSQVIQGVHHRLHLPWNEVLEGYFLDSTVLLLSMGGLGAVIL